jgi:AMIN domain
MLKKFRIRIQHLALCTLCLAVVPSVFSQSRPTVQRVALLGDEKGIQLKITSNQPVHTQTQLLTGPDRLVIDFPGAAPGSLLRGLAVNQGGIKSVRVGLFTATPPTTRVVVDLSSASPYEIVPDGNSVILKLGTGDLETQGVQLSSAQPGPGTALAAVIPPAPPAPHVQVNFQRGQLTVHAEKATLAEVLFAIQQRTGADIPIPAGAEQEQVVAEAGPGPAKDVLTSLLTGTHFNFIVVGSDQNDGGLKSVILSPKSEIETAMPAGMQPVTPVTQDQEVPDVPQEQGQMPPPVEPPAPPMQPNDTPGANQVPVEAPPNVNQGQPGQFPQNGPPPVQPVPDENQAPPSEEPQ